MHTDTGVLATDTGVYDTDTRVLDTHTTVSIQIPDFWTQTLYVHKYLSLFD